MYAHPAPPPNRIREQREAAGLTLQALAERIGTTNQQLSHLELGKRELTVHGFGGSPGRWAAIPGRWWKRASGRAKPPFAAPDPRPKWGGGAAPKGRRLEP
ncbi:helix-turn-helix domain-containing protein [Phenylobacterium kunshanense]|uniref:helix-turn-helix domain-containing protein n=1 Tax=Phenylobacterium kunshanense TaxID=1445034 RepID=UPI00197CB42B|nr:helix-turn-helix transcriptional regulator [Phenylobacterium kunshanense]